MKTTSRFCNTTLLCSIVVLSPSLSSAETKLWNNGNGAVIDVTTGLMWQKNIPDPANGLGVRADYCEKLTLSGSSDWRIPTIKEWFSLVDFDRKTATNSSTHHFDVKNYPELTTHSRYLSASYFADARFPDFEFLIQFQTIPGDILAGRSVTVDVDNLTTTNLRIACVAEVPSE